VSNAALYGDDYDADKILSSAGQYVTETLPLLRTINAMGKAAMGYRHHATMSSGVTTGS
jgi:hypothetical protein